MRVQVTAARSLVLLVSVLGVAGCSRSTEVADILDLEASGVVDVDTALAFSLLVSPDELAFVHVVQESPCPQPIGKITIRNSGRTRVTATVTGNGRVCHRAGPGRLVKERDVTVEAGQTVEVEMYFDCSTQSDFTSSVTVTAGTETLKNVRVVGDVRAR